MVVVVAAAAAEAAAAAALVVTMIMMVVVVVAVTPVMLVVTTTATEHVSHTFTPFPSIFPSHAQHTEAVTAAAAAAPRDVICEGGRA